MNNQFSIINNEIKCLDPKSKKHKNHLSNPSKLSCFSFDLPLSVCRDNCEYYKEKICYSQNNKLHESYSNRKKLLIRNLKLAKSDQFVKILTEQIKNKKQRIFRFFSSGDFIDMKNFKDIIKVCTILKDVTFWIPTHRDDLLMQYFEIEGLTIPKNCVIKLSCPIVVSDMPDFLKEFCKKYNLDYSCTSLNKDLVNCQSTLGHNDKKCGDCELCFKKGFNPVYLIHNITSISNSIKLVKKRMKKYNEGLR